MNQMHELKKREHLLRERVRSAPTGEFGASQEDRRWVVHQLIEMRELTDEHLRSVPASERQYEEYRLSFVLPLYTYLSRAYDVYYADIAEARR